MINERERIRVNFFNEQWKEATIAIGLDGNVVTDAQPRDYEYVVVLDRRNKMTNAQAVELAKTYI
jgi:hypothetical protein